MNKRQPAGLCNFSEYESLELETGNNPKTFEYDNKIEWCPNVKGFIVYALRLSNGHLYKGFTGDFRQRMLNHFNNRGCATTKRYKPLYIFHYEVYETKKEAMDRERYFKTIGGGDLKNMQNPQGFKPPVL